MKNNKYNSFIMNVVKKNNAANNSLIRVTVGEADYGQEVERVPARSTSAGQHPRIPSGHGPMGIVKKMYGKGVLAEQSYVRLPNAVFRISPEGGHRLSGRRDSAEEQGDFDFDNATEFEFVFEAIKLELSDKDKLTYNKIKGRQEDARRLPFELPAPLRPPGGRRR